jgi:hypothetical protein
MNYIVFLHFTVRYCIVLFCAVVIGGDCAASVELNLYWSLLLNEYAVPFPSLQPVEFPTAVVGI